MNRQLVQCQRCPRLREYCARIAREKRRAYQDHDYWGQPVPNFGDPRARLLVVGLAPAAHGANRTGRMFTGDRSGEWLYRSLHKFDFASQAEAVSLSDGLSLHDCAITAIAHCAPPDNKPAKDELAQCRAWLTATIGLLPVRVFVALGQLAWKATVDELYAGNLLKGRRPKFGHAAMVELAGSRWLIGSYHPSQQNTFTGRLTEEMLDNVFQAARRKLDE